MQEAAKSPSRAKVLLLSASAKHVLPLTTAPLLRLNAPSTIFAEAKMHGARRMTTSAIPLLPVSASTVSLVRSQDSDPERGLKSLILIRILS